MVSIPVLLFFLKSTLDRFRSHCSPETAFVKVSNDLHIVNANGRSKVFIFIDLLATLDPVDCSYLLETLFLLASMTPHCPGFLPASLPTTTMPSPLCSFFLISQPHNMKGLQGFDLGPLLFSTFTLMTSSSGLTVFSTTLCWWHSKVSLARTSSLNSRPVYPTAHWTSPFETSRASQSCQV